MSFKIRKMHKDDKNAVIEMMRTFYSSPAVFTNGSDEIFSADFENCVNENPYLDGFVIESSDGIVGYAMIAKSFSTEFGKPCTWIEDIYIKDTFRGLGLGNMLMSFIAENYKDCIFRLEVEEENKIATKLYKNQGFTILPYVEMKK